MTHHLSNYLVAVKYTRCENNKLLYTGLIVPDALILNNRTAQNKIDCWRTKEKPIVGFTYRNASSIYLA